MATVTSRPTNAPHLAPQVLHPLDRLRGTIRWYVVIEGLLAAAIFVAAWFALGLLLDFGLFKVATWDWVLDAPKGLRVAALVVAALLLAGIIALRIVGRLTRELSYPALALVLERRFPKVLGDRLITAVELADVEAQARYGYSKDMIRQTIEEARERVATMPVRDVFNWQRLRGMAFLAVGLFSLVVLVGFAGYAVATGTADPYRFGWRFAHVTGNFLERNVLLKNAPWPRRAHLELLDFPGEERRIGKDDPPLVVKAKAYRWVTADPAAVLGWRPLFWADLTEGLIGGPVPTLPTEAFRAAAEPGELPDDPRAWPVDTIQIIGLDDAEARARLLSGLQANEYEAVRTDLEHLFAALDDRAARPEMGRRLRKLALPEKVTLAYAGPTKSGDVTLAPQQHQTFAAPVSDLKESVRFVVRAEDFRTLPRGITLVPPPVFTKLTRTEYQPAYLHHAAPQGEGYSALRGLRQRMPEKPLSLTGDRSVFTVPSGTELVLTATADTDLTAAYLQPKVGILPNAIPGSAERVPVAVSEDKRTVNVELRGDYRLAAGRTFDHYYCDDEGELAAEEVTTTPTVEFDLIVEQADHVQARRQILIQVADDLPPVVEVAPDVIRRVGNVYYVTPKARIPFNPESYVRDDHGLSKVAYEITYWTEDSDVGRALRAQLAARSFLGAPTTIVPALHAANFKNLDKGDNRRTGSFGVARFSDLQRVLRSDTKEFLLRQLAEPLDDTAASTVMKVDLKNPDEDYFDLKPLKLLASITEVQTRYRLDLSIVATDTNYDTGPKTGQNVDPIRLLIVSEGDLLAEINKEEESFATRLDEALAKIAGARKKWEFVRTQNIDGRGTNSRDALDTVKVRAQDATQDIEKARDVTQTVVRDYRRIHRECIVNDVTEITRNRFGVFANRIDRVLGENPPLVTKEEAAFPAPKITFTVVDKRLESVMAQFNANIWADVAAVSDTDVSLLVLEQELKTLRAELGELQSREKLKKLLSSVIEQQKRITQELQGWHEELQAKLFGKTPVLVPIGPVFLAKGETKKIKQAINWRQYDSDDLNVKLTVTDAEKKAAPADAVSVPPVLKLNFEKNQLDFEYEVKAGAKDGVYTVTLTPESGDPVTIMVTVK